MLTRLCLALVCLAVAQVAQVALPAAEAATWSGTVVIEEQRDERPIGRRVYRLVAVPLAHGQRGQGRMLVQHGDDQWLVDAAAGQGQLVLGAGATAEPLALAPVPIAARSGAVSIAPAVVAGARVVSVRQRGDTWELQATVAVTLPNPIAFGLLGDVDDPAVRALAALPGLPVDVTITDSTGTDTTAVRRLRLVRCQPGATEVPELTPAR